MVLALLKEVNMVLALLKEVNMVVLTVWNI